MNDMWYELFTKLCFIDQKEIVHILQLIARSITWTQDTSHPHFQSHVTEKSQCKTSHYYIVSLVWKWSGFKWRHEKAEEREEKRFSSGARENMKTQGRSCDGHTWQLNVPGEDTTFLPHQRQHKDYKDFTEVIKRRKKKSPGFLHSKI